MSLTALFGVIAPAVLASTETPDYDFSREGSQHTKMLNSADILEAVLGTPLGEAERAYLVEYGETEDVFTNPQDPYTKALLSAIPIPDPKVERTRERLVYKDGELVSASSLTRRG